MNKMQKEAKNFELPLYSAGSGERLHRICTHKVQGKEETGLTSTRSGFSHSVATRSDIQEFILALSIELSSTSNLLYRIAGITVRA